MSKTFRQFDSRWGGKKYPPGSSCTVSGSGCGPTACADIIVNNPKCAKKTPVDTVKYMIQKGFAIAGHGTSWDGIDACLIHFGFKVVRHAKMATFFEEMAKGNRWAIILFAAGSRGGVTWTSGGHYLAASAYKVKNGKHYLYMRDPGTRRHDGWYNYEDHMKGLIKVCWTCYLPEESKPEPKKEETKKPAKTKKPAAKKPVATVSYKVGKMYTLKENMNVRTGPGTGYRKKKRSELTKDGKKHAKAGTYAVLKKGTKVTVKQVKNGWIRIPSGWICGKSGSKIYVK